MQVKLRLISQLINGLSRVFQILLKYFEDTLFYYHYQETFLLFLLQIGMI